MSPLRERESCCFCLGSTATGSAWISLLDLSLAKLSALDLSHLPPEMRFDGAGVLNAQTREIFAAEAEMITERCQRIVWLVPSCDENVTGPALHAEPPESS
jgi:exodeoxyribonuclease-5